MKSWLTFTSLVFGLLAASVQAEDWPQWRGPERNGISQETGLMAEWPESGPPLLWHADNLGYGFSTPSVVGDSLYLLSNEGLDNEYIEARRVEDGSSIWKTRLGKVGNPDQRPNYPGARSTPTVDGDRLYVLSSDGDLACIERTDGTIVWQRSVRADFGGKPGQWAYAESPLIDGDALVCTPGGGEATIVALNKKTGDPIWTCALSDESTAGYASPVISHAAGIKQYVHFLSDGLAGVDAETGELLWRYAHTAQDSPANIPTPVVDGAYVYSATSLGGGGLVEILRDNGTVTANEVYFAKNLPSAIGGAVLWEGNLYGADDDVLTCVNFETGDIAWQDRSIGSSSLCYADGRFYLHGTNGQVALVEATAEGYRERGRFTPPDSPDLGESRAWAYPVVANGRLYIRALGSLWCYQVADQGRLSE